MTEPCLQSEIKQDLPPEAEGLTPAEIAEAERIYHHTRLRYKDEVPQDSIEVFDKIYWVEAFKKVKAEKDKKQKHDLPPEAEGLTPAEIAEAERIYHHTCLKYKNEITQDTMGMLDRIYWLGAFRQIKAERDKQAGLDEKFNNLIRLPVFPYPEATRIVSNDMARSALFSAIQGADRKLIEKQLLATIEGVEIIFTGRQLNQDDHDLLMQLVHLARDKPFGEYITVPAKAILTGLGCDTGGKDHKELKTRMERLLLPLIELKNTRTKITYYGHIIEDAIQDEESRYWVYRLNPKMRPLYDQSSFTLIEWDQRKALKRKDLARWLQSFYATHADPFPLSVEYLHRMSGSNTREIWKFRENLKKALDVLVSIGFLLAWEISPKGDLVAVHRSPTQKALPSSS